MKRHTDKTRALGRDTGMLYTEHYQSERGEGEQTAGYVNTSHGTVGVRAGSYRSTSTGWAFRWVVLEIARGQTVHERRIDGKVYSHQYLVTLAKRFASEIAFAEAHS